MGQLEFLEEQHRGVLAALSGEVETLKLENRDLKFRLVMRDTATPKTSKRADKQPAAPARPDPASQAVLDSLRQEIVDLRAKNKQLQDRAHERAASQDDGSMSYRLEVE